MSETSRPATMTGHQAGGGMRWARYMLDQDRHGREAWGRDAHGPGYAGLERTGAGDEKGDMMGQDRRGRATSCGANALGLRLIGAWCRRLYQAGCDGGLIDAARPRDL
ncbi:hypothetical protein [Novacetimonas hansenii]|uniref:hypothetical protein n=1 Tax=Novacetimonas hansenii TaxID=436 RepID=UPI00117AA4CD|nr:hypothetical protein [Novacetimonas hansenii]